MTATWYDTPQKIAALEASARAWLGTPFRANSAVRGAGGGVSCHNLAAELYFETGYLPRFAVPSGNVRNLALGLGPALMDRFPRGVRERFQLIAGSEEREAGSENSGPPISGSSLLAPRSFLLSSAAPGDLLVLREGRIVKHLGVMLSGGLFVHVLARSGVQLSALSDSTYCSNLEEIRRPTP